MSTADLRLPEQWVTLNLEVILGYWNGEIDTLDAMRAIKPLGKAFPE